MAANDSGNLYTPSTGTEPAPVTAETPRRSAFRPINSTAAPTAAPAAPATAPASTTPFQWTAQPSAPAAPVSSAPATTAPATTAPTTTPTPVAPVTRPVNPAPASDGDNGGAFSVGVDKVKGFALRAKNSLTEGDDLSASAKRGGPRKARVLVSRIDPWSVLKIGFLLSIAIGIMMVVAVFVLWNALNEFGLFALVDEWVAKLFEGEQPIDITKIFELNKVMSATILVSVMNVVLLTALSTIGAFLYNTVSSVVGGVYVTLTDD
ncbi:DUF3566 domain-containing protein [Demequina sp.]|uniref:DUF3566 domain-containing protein n=1 Tax=Demequina sp. TaxID=2050685 RepID=UPI003D0B42CC